MVPDNVGKWKRRWGSQRAPTIAELHELLDKADQQQSCRRSRSCEPASDVHAELKKRDEEIAKLKLEVDRLRQAAERDRGKVVEFETVLDKSQPPSPIATGIPRPTHKKDDAPSAISSVRFFVCGPNLQRDVAPTFVCGPGKADAESERHSNGGAVEWIYSDYWPALFGRRNN